MGFRIEDGKGRGFQAAVSSHNFLRTSTFERREIVHASSAGSAYVTSSGFLNITTPSTNYGILFLQNDLSVPFYLDEIIVSSNGTYTQWSIIRNPTTGTLVSSGNAIVPINLNFSSGATFTGVTKSGGQGYTITNGVSATMILSLSSTQIQTAEAIILQKGNSLGIIANVASAATVISTLTGYYHDGNGDV